MYRSSTTTARRTSASLSACAQQSMELRFDERVDAVSLPAAGIQHTWKPNAGSEPPM